MKTISDELSQTVELAVEIVGPCPTAGGGVHRWLFKAAAYLARLQLPAEQIADAIELATQGCGREVPSFEIASAVDRAFAIVNAEDSGLVIPRGPTFPERDAELVEKAVAEYRHLDCRALWDASPFKLPWPREPLTREIIRHLVAMDFEGTYVCAGVDIRRAVTLPFCKHEALHRCAQVVPNAMTARTGTTQAGKKSARCLENTGPRGMIVVDFDHELPSDGSPEAREAALNRQAAMIGFLADRFHSSLALVMSTGGKSLHSWFGCRGLSEDQQIADFNLACRLGADCSLWPRSSWVRMPDGERRDKNTGRSLGPVSQPVLFYNPSATEISNHE